MATLFQKQAPQMEVSPEQEVYRKREAEELLKKLQFLLMEGQTPALDILSEALTKVEELLAQTSRQSNIDTDTRKTLEDISALLLAARQTAKNKGIADKLQRIGEETQKALKTYKPGVSGSEVTQDLIEFMNTWRPVFYLLLSSRDFRQLILDSIRISKRVLYSYKDNISDEPTQKFVEGERPKEVAQQVKEEIKQMGSPELTDEEWERIQDDLQRVLATLSKEPTFRDGMERLFNLLDMFQRNLLQDRPMTSTGVPVPEDIHIRRAIGETEELISSFSGREILEHFKYFLGNLIRKAREDQKFHSYLCELKEFILKAKSEQEIKTEEFKRKSKDLARRGREIIREWKENDLRYFLDAANLLIENIKNDEYLQLLRHHAGVVQSDLSYTDTEGKLQVDTDMLTNLQKVLLPVMADALKYIPVPRIQSSDAYREFWLDKIVLCSYDIIPENIKFHLETDSSFSLQDIEVKGTHTYLVIQLNHLLTELKDVEFYYKKKTFPELEDKGRVNLRVKGQGARLTFTYNIEQNPQDKSPRIMKGHVDFDISDLDIEFDTSTIQHTVLVPMLTKIFKPQIKDKIEKEVEKNLGGFISKLGDLLTSNLAKANRPFLSGLEMAKKTIKSSELGQVYQKRREKLE